MVMGVKKIYEVTEKGKFVDYGTARELSEKYDIKVNDIRYADKFHIPVKGMCFESVDFVISKNCKAIQEWDKFCKRFRRQLAG